MAAFRPQGLNLFDGDKKFRIQAGVDSAAYDAATASAPRSAVIEYGDSEPIVIKNLYTENWRNNDPVATLLSVSRDEDNNINEMDLNLQYVEAFNDTKGDLYLATDQEGAFVSPSNVNMLGLTYTSHNIVDNTLTLYGVSTGRNNINPNWASYNLYYKVDLLEQQAQNVMDTLEMTLNMLRGQIGSDIQSEQSRAITAEGLNSDAIGANVLAIAAEATAARAAEDANAAAVTSEAETARAAEDENSQAIATETETARAAEGVNAAAVTSEATTARAAEGLNATAIAAEATRATGVETTNASAITDERERAMLAEGVLRVAEAGLRGDLTTETTRATEAEAANADRLTAIESLLSAFFTGETTLFSTLVPQ